jgi:hypothetical protein
VDDIFYDTPHVAVAFCKVKGTQTGWVFIEVGVRFELVGGNVGFRLMLIGQSWTSTYDSVRASLCPNNPTH